MTVLLDNGHGIDTAGKRSPDGALREYQYARSVVDAVCARLSEMGMKFIRVCPETEDISLTERVKRVNRYCKNDKCILVSVHNNASGTGKTWEAARGWSVFVNTRCSEQSKKLGELFGACAQENSLTVRKERPGCLYWSKTLYILSHTNCPAVLTENLFMDNRRDIELLLSEKGFEAIVQTHVNAIKKYVEKYG